MSNAIKKIKKAVESRREFVLEAEGAPRLKARIKPVALGNMLTATGVVESPFLSLFDGRVRDADARNELMPSYGDDPEEFDEFLALGKKMAEAYLVLGLILIDENGDKIDIGFSNTLDGELVTPLDLKEVYGNKVIEDIEDRIKLLSNGRVPSEVMAPSTADRFQKAVN